MNRSVMLWLASLVLVAIGSAWVSGQMVVPQKIDPPIVVSGPDLRFSIEARQGTKAIGKFYVRIEGRWVEADMLAGPIRPSN